MSDIETLNVGGSLYTTTVSTLTRYPDSMLGSMFSDRIPSHRDSNGHYIIDGDGPIFRHVLNFLRRSSLCLPNDFKEWDLLSAEADFYQIKELIDAVKKLKRERMLEGGRQKIEFIDISFSLCDSNEVVYRGTAATLKAIPTLLLHFNCQRESPTSMNQTTSTEECIDANGWIVIRVGQRGLEKEVTLMKIFQEITQLGFRLLKTSTREESQTQMILFGRNTE